MRLVVHRLRVTFTVASTYRQWTEVISVQDGWDEGEVRAACAGTQGWPMEAAQYVVIESIEPA